MKRKIKKDQKKIKKGHFEHFDLTIWVFDAFADDMLFHETCNLMASRTHVQEHPKTQRLVAIPPMLCSTLLTSICLSTPPIVEWPVSCFQSTVRHTSGLPTPYTPGIQHNNEIYPTYGTRNSAIFAFGHVLLAWR